MKIFIDDDKSLKDNNKFFEFPINVLVESMFHDNNKDNNDKNKDDKDIK